MNTHKPNTTPTPTPAPLPSVGAAIAQSEEVGEEIKRAADDLAVVHAVLDTRLADAPTDEDVKRAVAETLEVEKRLSKSADKLEQVNETLVANIESARQSAGAKWC
ncbi:MAG: hypothetical protein ABIO71_02785 [Caldimonas sp.]